MLCLDIVSFRCECGESVGEVEVVVNWIVAEVRFPPNGIGWLVVVVVATVGVPVH